MLLNHPIDYKAIKGARLFGFNTEYFELRSVFFRSDK